MRLFTLLLAMLCGLQTGPAVAKAPAEVTYLANEGFLIEVGSKKILVDALFDDATMSHCHVHSEETLQGMKRAAPPFDGVDLILVTHGHRDHFAPAPVLEHLANDPGSVLVGPPQAIDQLRSRRPEFDKVKARVREVKLEPFDSAELTIGGIRLQAHRIHHSQFMEKDEETGEQRNRHADVENLAYLVEIDGVRLLHVGDAVLPLNREFFESERFPEGETDIVFLEFFDWSDETREILRRMKPGHVVFMHLPPQKEKIESLTQHLSEKFSNAVVFQEPLDTRSF